MPDSSQFIWLFFRFSGRVSRAAYFLSGLLINVVVVFPLYRFMRVTPESTEGQIWAVVFLVAVLAALWSSVATSVKRLHDLDRPGILAASLVIPFISYVAFIALCLLPGNPGPNQYGAQTNAPR